MRFSFHAAPAFLLAYGVVRLLDGLDGRYGPELLPAAEQAFMLAFLLLYGIVIVALWRGASGGFVAGAAAVAGLVGLVASLASLPVLLAGGRSGVLYEAGPLLLVVGPIVLLVLLALARPQRVSWWALFLLAFGLLVFTIDPRLLPVSAALGWLGLASVDPGAVRYARDRSPSPVGVASTTGSRRTGTSSSPG